MELDVHDLFPEKLFDKPRLPAVKNRRQGVRRVNTQFLKPNLAVERDADDVARPASVWRWFRTGEWRNGPPIVSLLMRTATVSTGRDLAAAREATDVLVLPEVAGIEIRDWKAYDRAVEAGYQATRDALSKLTRPVTELRRRASLAEEAERARLAPFGGARTAAAE